MEAARLQDATPEDWEAELQQLEHAEEIRQQLFTVSRLLQDGDPAAAQMLAEAVSALRGIAGYQDSIRQLEERLVSLRIELEDIASEADKLGAAARQTRQGLRCCRKNCLPFINYTESIRYRI